MNIDRERLARYFTTLCQIESPSRQEKSVSDYLRKVFNPLQPQDIVIDDSGKATGSDTGNLTIRFPGNNNTKEPVFFCCHMDTVLPANGIEVIREKDIFRSSGDTILGADDKSGIAPLIEMMTVLRENDLAHCPIELVFTTCEEIGLLGAKAFDASSLHAQIGYALDSSSDGVTITGAPAANRVKVTIIGKAAHSGLSPETGINALTIATDALSQINFGRLDNQSTANFGLINGGTATNIIPERITLQGEVRSHTPALLQHYTKAIISTFEQSTARYIKDNGEQHGSPQLQVDIYEDFPAMELDEQEPVIARLKTAAAKLGFPMTFDVAGGGSDANIFHGKGLRAAILPTGMQDVHTTGEWVDLNSMVELTNLLLAVVTPD